MRKFEVGVLPGYPKMSVEAEWAEVGGSDLLTFRRTRDDSDADSPVKRMVAQFRTWNYWVEVVEPESPADILCRELKAGAMEHPDTRRGSSDT